MALSSSASVSLVAFSVAIISAAGKLSVAADEGGNEPPPADAEVVFCCFYVCFFNLSFVICFFII